MRPRGGVRRDLRLSFADAAGFGAMAGVAEVYVPAFGLAIGMPIVLAGLLATVPMLAGGVIQLVAPRAIGRVRSIRAWVVACTIVQALSFAPLIYIALSGQWHRGLVFASAGVYWVAGMGASAGWTPWMTRVVPSRIRGRFFGRRMGLVQATMLMGLVGAGCALHAFAGTDRILDVYAAMFALALVARLASAFALSRQGHGLDLTPTNRMRLRSIPVKLRGTPRLTLLAYLLAAGAAGAISGPFLTPYLLDHHGIGYVHYSVFTATIIVTKIFALPLVGRVIQRLGVRRVLTASSIAIVPIAFMWMVHDAFWWFLVIQVYAGIAWAGYDLGMVLALFDGDDDAERTTLQVAFSALQAMSTAGASLVGGAVLGFFGTDADAYLWVFAVSAVARIAAAGLLITHLPQRLIQLPFTMVTRAWTLGVRPWGGTIVRPIVGIFSGGRGDPPSGKAR